MKGNWIAVYFLIYQKHKNMYLKIKSRKDPCIFSGKVVLLKPNGNGFLVYLNMVIIHDHDEFNKFVKNNVQRHYSAGCGGNASDSKYSYMEFTIGKDFNFSITKSITNRTVRENEPFIKWWREMTAEGRNQFPIPNDIADVFEYYLNPAEYLNIEP